MQQQDLRKLKANVGKKVIKNWEEDVGKEQNKKKQQNVNNI